MSYHTIIFAPDTLDPDGGPTVQMPGHELPGLGTQTTLPVDEPTAVLYDDKDQPIYFENPTPRKRRIGFVRG